MLNDDAIGRERRALRSIQMRNQRPVLPLENIDGSNSVIDSILLLQDSPLCWVGTLGIDDEFRAGRVLASLQELYERAMQPWEQFRTVQPNNNSLSACRIDYPLQDEKVIAYDRWPYGTFPVEIQRESRMRYRELKTTSRFSMEDVPSKWALERLNPPCDPLDFRHLAGLAATACIVEALEQYEETIEEWAYVVCRELPGVPFTWLAQHDPGRLELILAAYTDSGRSGSRAREIQAAMLVKNAESWLSLADLDDQHQAEIEQVAVRSNAQVAVKVQAEISSRNRVAGKKTKKAIDLTPQVVADYFKTNASRQVKANIADLADNFNVSKRTVSTRLQEAKKSNLMQ